MPKRPQRHRYLLTLGIGLAVLAGCQTPPAGVTTPGAAPYPRIAQELVVKFKPESSETEREALRARYGVSATDGLKPGIERWHLQGQSPESAVQSLLREKAIAFAQPNYLRKTQAYIQGGTPPTSQWYLKGDSGIDVAAAWQKSTAQPPGKDVVVAVVDTGVDTEHPALSANILPGNDVNGKRFLDMVGDGPEGTDKAYRLKDGNGHGTHVAGILAANASGSTGLIGVAPGAKILPVKVMRADGNGDDFTIAKGFKAAVDAGADIINFSVGGPAPSPILAEAIADGIAKGKTFIIASGNEHTKVFYPAAYTGVIAVGATSTNTTVAPYSNYGPEQAVVAPGGHGNAIADGIYSTLPRYSNTSGRTNYGVQSGTSMATPVVSGVAALILADARAHGQSLSPAQIRARLVASAKPLNGGFNEDAGFGLVQPAAALSGTSHDGAN
ncbi:Major intracellular serine protease precursor [compost metagenome]